jgi:3-oxoacyl-[acyl-carrier protein] reductase
MGSLIGKRALVTGAEQGIGRAVAEQLVDAGCDVAIHYFSGMEGPEQTVARAIGLGRRAARFQADCTDEAATNALVDDAASFLGGLDILINNVGGLIGRRGLAEVDLAFWRTVIDVNMTTMMMVTRRAIPHLEAAGASSIVNLASLAGRKGGHGGSLVYSMAKGAVLTFTRALSAELGPKGVRVNAVAPGLILGTRFHDTFTTKESVEETIQGIPLGRAGGAEDVARPIVYLASEYDGFISGATIDINGGIYCA